jgi:hypothetical protein
MSNPVKSVTLFRNPKRKEVWIRTSQIWQRFIGLGFGLVILFSSWCVQAQENVKSEDVGFVLDIDGKWFLDGKLPQRILRGQSLPAKGTIRIQLPKAKSNKIEVILLNGERISRRCNKPEACNQPILLPEVIKSRSSTVDRVVVAVKEVFTSYPEKFVATLSKEKNGLQDAVIKLENGQVDLSPVFKNMEKDLYLLRFQKVVLDDKLDPGVAPDPINFNWESGRSSSVSVNGLKPGLYKLKLLETTHKEHEPIDEAWILVSEPEKHERVFTFFQGAIELTEQWSRDGLEPELIRSFLHAYLASLAEPQSPAKK